MPTYEYQCKECGHLFEAFQAITEEPLKQCPKCNGSIRRLISSGAGLIFKGSGFYITDYKKNSVIPSSQKQSESKETSSSDTKDSKSKGKGNTDKKEMK
jgi:putative FmdB family regulatory protein